MPGGVHRLNCKFRHQTGQHQSKQNKRAGPDHPPKVVAAASLFVPALDFCEFERRCKFGVGGNGGFLVPLEAGLPVNFRARSDRERIALFTQGTADESGNRRTFRKTKKITPYLSIQRQGFSSGRKTAADFPAGVQIESLVPEHDVAFDRAGDGDIVRPGAEISIHHAADAHGLREADKVAIDVAGDIHLVGERINIAVDIAINPDVLAGSKEVALDRLAFSDVDRVTLAEFSGRCGRGNRHHHAKAGEQNGQRRATPQVTAECEQAEASHGSQGKYFEQAEHGLPSFPECALKHHQIQQIRAAEAGLFELEFPGLDISRVQGVDAQNRQTKDHAPNPLHVALHPLVKLR